MFSAASRLSRSFAQTSASKRALLPSTPFSLQQFRSLFIQTEETPNPESLKFLPGRIVLDVEEGGEVGNGFYATRTDKEEIARSPLAKDLFQVEGVKSVYLGNDFVTVTKFAQAHWMHVKTQVFSALMDFYQKDLPAVSEVAIVTDTTILDDDDEVVAMIKELLESRIRPAVQEDGGDIRYVGFSPESGLVTVQLAGSCVGCPSSAVTLKNGVENMLMHYIPEVTGVEALEDDEEGEGGGPVQVTETKGDKTYEERLAAAGIPFSD
jgi:Fe-S cluster biogenesis protein NfuA